MKEINTQFLWKCQREATRLVQDIVEQGVRKNSALAELKRDLDSRTSTQLFDWIDHVAVGMSKKIVLSLSKAGFHLQKNTSSYQIYVHAGAQLPRVVVRKKAGKEIALAVTVDSIADFLLVRGMHRRIKGSFYASYRSALITEEAGVCFYVVERRGSQDVIPATLSDKERNNILKAYELWQTRKRDALNFSDEDEALRESYLLAKEMVGLVGDGMAAHIVLEIERKYWQAKNRAGQIQKCRQDSVGMGWANHDHHTFRSSRRHFRLLVNLFEELGFRCRERFYAGKEAGWGAQVMEHTKERFVLFLDVDLTVEEIAVDFAHQDLPELDHLGTIGLWCGLHGESILRGGMHHLEAQFSFDKLTKDLKVNGVMVMSPFSNFPYLKQAFTQGECWPVPKVRIDALLKKKLITKKQAAHFMAHGALGSHLENLQRKYGFKGFNQKNVSSIIRRTDPRGA